MAVLILPICFVLIFLGTAVLTESTRVTIILCKSLLVFSGLIVLITELGSLFNSLNFQFILLAWVFIAGISIYFLLSRRERVSVFFSNIVLKSLVKLQSLTRVERILCLLLSVILGAVFVQGLIYPPNNWDSMTYHMARIPFWISHQSLHHYPTPVFRQLYQPPFTGFAILHLNILSGSDYFSNSVQFFFLIFSCVVVILIGSQLRLRALLNLTLCILMVTIPDVALEASSTQNDIVVSFFVLAAVYFAFRAYTTAAFLNFFFLGLSCGLAVLSKGTAYIFLSPILLFYAVATLLGLYKRWNYKVIWYSLLAAFIFVAVNSGHYLRNYSFNRSFLGLGNIQTPQKDFNEHMSALLLSSNILKNVGLQIGGYPLNGVADKIIYKLHDIAGIDINASGTNYRNFYYRSPGPYYINHEDGAPNTFHFILIAAAFIIVLLYYIKGARDSRILIYMTGVILQGILFCFIFKWTPWNTRLHMTLFIESLPIIVYAGGLNKVFNKVIHAVIFFLVFYAFVIIIFNRSRPFISNRYTADISLSDERFKKYFTNKPGLYPEYRLTMDSVTTHNFRNIGLMLDEEDFGYPLISDAYTQKINPVNLNVSNETKDIPSKNQDVDCIISTSRNDSLIEYSGRKYYNISPTNKLIWLYR